MKGPLFRASQRIHILGLGNLGRLFAHSLASKPNPPPITLLFHRQDLLKEWKEAGSRITITQDGIPSSSQNYDIEMVNSVDGIKPESIMNLIVATKATKTREAVESLKGRLAPGCIILYAQNGVTESPILTNLYHHPNSLLKQPTFTLAITSHGLFSLGPFTSVLAGHANMILFHDPCTLPTPASSSFLQELQSSPLLKASIQPIHVGSQMREEKLTANATINPLSTLFRLKNGDLLNDQRIIHLMHLLIAEIGPVLSKCHQQMTEAMVAQGLTEDLDLFKSKDLQNPMSPRSIYEYVTTVAKGTAENKSSMLQDLQAGRETEIDFINGWIVKTGEKLGFDMSVNQEVIKMVKAGRKLEVEEVETIFHPYREKLKGLEFL